MKKFVKRFKDNLASKRGMTLVEVLVAMSILMIIIFTFTPLFAQYFKNVRNAGQMTRKTYEKASLIERLLSNRDSDNKGAYETYNVGVPLELYVKNSSNTTLKTLDFHTKANSNYVSKVEGNMVTTDGDKSNSGNEYTTIYLGSTSQRLIAFPKALTDDFIEKEVMVVPIGFPENFDITKFHVYYTDENGNWQTHELTKGEYYKVEDATDGDVPCAKFTFYGANEYVCFDNSPLVITYNSHQVEIEIIAPKIIMVGEKASDGNYYYYATSGVDTRTGRMDLIAKESAHLTSAMNDVEWVDKGEGDNGKGGVNTYGYYIMGGDAGQVRRFWQKKDLSTTSTSENYAWGGDDLYNYDRYLSVTKNALNQTVASSDSKEIFDKVSKTEQASFKSVFHSENDEFSYNGNPEANILMGSSKFSLLNLKYKSVISDYYTANVTKDDHQLSTVARILNYTKKNGDVAIYAGNGTQDWLSNSSSGANKNLYTWIGTDNDYGKNLTIDGYKTATNYKYSGENGEIDDNSLITITSVGAIQINTANPKYYKQTQQGLIAKTGTNENLYPTESYTLYCGRIPAVANAWGYASGDQEYYLAAELGMATNGEEWYPVGKFGDTKTISTTLSNSIFNTGQSGTSSDSLSWKSLNNFGSSQDLYPEGKTTTSVTEHDGEKWIGSVDHTLKISYWWYGYDVNNGLFSGKQWNNYVKTFEVTKKGKEYTSPRYTDKKAKDAETNDSNHPFVILEDIVNGVKVNSSNLPYTDYFEWDDGWVVREASDNNTAYNGHKHREWKMKTTTTSYESRRYYGPTKIDSSILNQISGSDSVTKPSDVSNYTLTTRSFVGSTLPEQGNDYYMTAGEEVDVTMGYLSHPYAISVGNPETPTISGTTGSDYYFKKFGSNIKTSKFGHSFFSGGLRDNVTMLDVKSVRDEISGNNISLAVGYTLSYILNDYSWMIRLGHVMNNGIVYIRATGDGTIDENNETAGNLGSGKGWSIAKETNVFHQFYGIDQYQNSSGTSTALGWDTNYHRAYFNLGGDPGGTFQWITGDTKAPQANYSPNFVSDDKTKNFYGSENNGTNCHPMAQTEVNTVNWGQTWDEKLQAMWGTANGTLLSWFYDYEEAQSGTYTNSKITGVRKEFESYMWADRYGKVVDNHYDYATGKVTGSGNNQKVSYNNTNGFISVLDSVNSVYYGDSYWVAVGNCSMKDPASYCQSGKGNYTASGSGTYINVKSTDDNNTYKWTAVKVSTERINFVSVEYCEGIWYAMGYKDNGGSAGKNSDKAGNGMQDPGEEGVIFYATNPTIADLDSDPDYMSGGGYFDGSYTGGWRQALTRNKDNEYTKETTVMKRAVSAWKSFVFEGANSMASQG